MGDSRRRGQRPSWRDFMGRQRMAARLVKYFGLALLVFAGVMTLLFSHFFEENYVGRTRLQMYRRALQVAEFVRQDGLRPPRAAEDDGQRQDFRQRLLREMAALTDEDIWIVAADGRVEMYGHTRPPREEREKMRAAAGRLGRDLRTETEFLQKEWERRGAAMFPPLEYRNMPLDTLPETAQEIVRKGLRGEVVMTEREMGHSPDVISYVTAPVLGSDGSVAGVVVLRQPVFGLRQALYHIARIYVFCLFVAIVLALAVSVALSLKFSKPLQRLKEVTGQVAAGNFQIRTEIRRGDEIGELARSLDHMTEMLAKVQREREHMEQSRKVFISNITHELRTPVTVVRGSLEALRDKIVTEPAEVARYYDTMYREVLFQQRLINDLLELSRLQNPEFSIAKQPLNFVAVLQEAVRNARHLGRSQQVEVTISTDRDVYRLSGDYGRLVQMLLVFLDNAIKFSTGPASVEVVLRGRRVTITDHGAGMTEEELRHIFERFYRSWDARNKNGSGLGLTIARNICERHGIDCRVDSQKGQGTTVTLYLPDPEPVDCGDGEA